MEIFIVRDLHKRAVVPISAISDISMHMYERRSQYALRTGRERCKLLVVTDGIRYALHCRSDHDFKLEAYLNILNMRDSYPVLNCAGAVKAVLGMAR